LGGKFAFNYVFNHQPDPQFLAEAWDHLPEEAKTNTVNWGKGKAGEIVGGSIVSAAISKGLSRMLPKRFVLPFMFVTTCQGYMASIWSNNWNGGPPPPPTGGGSGLTA
jgi:hypothetical protein